MKIKSIELQNFGFFGKLDSLHNPLSKIGGKHTLLYGENGSGKTSLFRALQLLLESSFASDEATIQQYFDKKHAASQVNIWANTAPKCLYTRCSC